MIRLDRFDNSGFDRGRPRVVELAWMTLHALFSSGLPGSGWRCWLLRRFGARIGHGVVIKPRVRVKFPWRLQIGDHVWIGEAAWIDNLAEVRCDDHVCISQGVYICTGNHRFELEGFDLQTRPVHIGTGSWLGAFCRVAPGTRVLPGTRVRMASLVHGQVGIDPALVNAGPTP